MRSVLDLEKQASALLTVRHPELSRVFGGHGPEDDAVALIDKENYLRYGLLAQQGFFTSTPWVTAALSPSTENETLDRRARKLT